MSRVIFPRVKAFNAAGAPLVGGLVYVYEIGTTTYTG